MATPNNEQLHQATTPPIGNASIASSGLSDEQHLENEDVTMEESTPQEATQATPVPGAPVTDNTPVRTWLESNTTMGWDMYSTISRR